MKVELKKEFKSMIDDKIIKEAGKGHKKYTLIKDPFE